MTRYAKRYWLLASSLAGLAGYVDAIGFLKLGGLFVSFMSGNSTQLAVSLVQGTAIAWLAAGAIAAFVGGVVAGSVVAATSGAVRKTAVLLSVCLCLVVSALCDGAGADRSSAFLLAAGMGAMNCVFQRDGEVSIGVTYMTGTLVKLGQHIVASLLGPDRFGWLPYLLLWSGLVVGAVAGAASYPALGPKGIWLAAGIAAVLSLIANLMGRVQPATPDGRPS